MENLITIINSAGRSFVDFSLPMLVQSTVLIILILALDLIIRKRVRAIFRYCIWMLVLAKLVLPTTLSSPVSLGYLFGDKLSHNVPQIEPPVAVAGRSEPAFQTPLSQAVPPPVITPEITPEPEPVAVSPQSAVAPYSAPASLSWQGLAFLIWLSAVTAMALLLIQRIFFVRGLLARSKDPDDAILDIFRQCRDQMRLRRPVSLKLSPFAASPSVCGLFRPTILIPQNLPAELNRQDYTSILLHELAHIKRGDLLISLIQTILQIAYFYNPLLWLANAVIRNVREQAVDEMVLVAMAARADAYPRSLLNISKLTFTRPAFSLRLIGVVESKKALINRIKHIVSRPFPKSAKLGLIGLLVILAVGALLLPMAAAKKENKHAGAQTAADPFVTSLPNSVTVELLGVCKHPIEGRQWWKPDGVPLDEPPFDYQKEDRVYAGEKELAYEFAVRYSNIPEDMDSIFYAEPSNSSVGGTLSSDTKKNGKRLQEYKNGKLISTVSKLATVFDKERKTCDIKVGISDGPWQTTFESIRSKTKDAWGTSGQGRSEGGAIFAKPTEEEQKTYLTITHTFDRRVYDLKVIALHQDGDILKPVRSSGNSVANATQLTLCFDMPLQYITEFRVQTRKYQWLTFENVSLNPDQRTDVQIEVQDIPAKDHHVSSAVDQNHPGYDNLSPYVLFHLFGEMGTKLEEALTNDTIPPLKEVAAARTVINLLAQKCIGTQTEEDASSMAQSFEHFEKNLEEANLDQARMWLAALSSTYSNSERRFDELNEKGRNRPSNSHPNLPDVIAPANDTSPYLSVLDHDSAAEVQPPLYEAAKKGNYRLTLPNGVEVKMLAISELLPDRTVTWQPNGTRPPYSVYLKPFNDFDRGDDHYAFTLSLFGATVYQPKVEWLRIGAAEGTPSRLEVVYLPGYEFVERQSFYAAKQYLPNEDTTKLSLRIACDNWQTRKSYDGRYSSGDDDKVTFIEAYQTGGGVRLVLSHAYKNVDIEVAAEYPVDGVNTSARAVLTKVMDADGNELTAATFSLLKLEDIAEFKFSTRPFYYVQFDNVSLRPSFNIEKPPSKAYDLTGAADYMRKYFDEQEQDSRWHVIYYQILDSFVVDGNDAAVACVCALSVSQDQQNANNFTTDTRAYFLYRKGTPQWQGIFSADGFNTSAPYFNDKLKDYHDRWCSYYIDLIEQGYASPGNPPQGKHPRSFTPPGSSQRRSRVPPTP